VRALVASLVAAAWLAGAGSALAHVEVLPDSVPAGTAVEFTIRVPTERNVATAGVRVEFPSQVTVFSFADPPPGWQLLPLRAPNGRFRGVVYRGGRIPPERYADFRLLGTPFEEGVAVWPTRQTYADGQVKPWTGPPELPGQAESSETGPTAPGPAPAVQIGSPGSAPAATAANDDDGSGAAIWLGVIAIGIALLSALAVGFLWSTRPAKLPDDDEEP
jgi:Domain of unkown function (DUF1775)